MPLLGEAAFSRYKLLFLFARQLMPRIRSLSSQGSGAMAGAQPFIIRPHKEVPPPHTHTHSLTSPLEGPESGPDSGHGVGFGAGKGAG